MKKFLQALVLVVAMLLPWAMNAQTPSVIAEGFEGGSLPSGWTASGSHAWLFTNTPSSNGISYAHGGSYCASFTGEGDGDHGQITSPVVDLSSATAPQISFWYVNPDWGGDQNTLTVKYSTDGGTTWATAQAFSTNVMTWTEVTINLPAAAATATFKVQFDGYDDYGYNILLDDIYIGSAPTCLAPSMVNLLSVSATDATLGWTENGTATQWEFEYSTSSFTPGDNTAINTTVSEDSIELSNLTANTVYHYALRSVCSSSDMSIWVTGTFRTDCVPVLTDSLPYSYGFEGTLASSTATLDPCWHKGTNYSTYPYPSSTSHSGTRSLYFYATTTYRSWACLPQFEADINTLMLRFWVRKSSDSYTGKTTIGVMTDPSDWSTFTPIETLFAASTAWEEMEVCLNNYNGNNGFLTIAADVSVGSEYGYNYIYVDDVTVLPLPNCPRPSDVVVSNPTENSLDIAWNEAGEATSWNIAYDTVPITDFDNANIAVAGSNPFTLTGLDGVTRYYIYVQSDCGSETSEWSNAAVGQTVYSCGDTLTYASVDYGNPTSTSTSYYLVYASYGNSITQTIYTAEELTNMGLNRGYVRELTVNWNTQATYSKNVKVYLAGTNKTQFAGTASTEWVPAADHQLVYTNTAFSNPVGAQTLILDSSFYWDGTSNICLTWISNNDATSGSTSTSTSSGMSARGTATAGVYRNRYAYRDGATSTYSLSDLASLTSGSRSTGMPNVTFAGCFEMANCPTPRNVAVSNIDTTEATITWTEAGQASTWNVVVVDYETAEPDTCADMVTVFDNNYLAMGLQGAHNYHVYVRSACGGDENSHWATATFRTECPTYITIPFAENFDAYSAGSLPDCAYTGSTYSTQPSISTTYAASGANSFYMYVYQSSSATTTNRSFYVAPMIDTLTNPINTLNVSFKWYASSYSTSQYPGSVVVGVVTDPTDVNTMNNTFYPVDTLYATAESTWFEGEVNLNNVPDSIPAQYIAIVSQPIGYTSTYAYNYVYIDDVRIALIPDCNRPSSIAVAAVDSVSATIAWPAEEDTYYDLAFGIQGFNPDNIAEDDTTAGIIPSVSGSPYQVLNLQGGVFYDFYVRTNCSDGNSEWRGPATAAIGNFFAMRSGQVDTLRGCGWVITDDGGADGQYSANFQNSTVIVYPSDGNMLQVSGTCYVESSSWDPLVIYEGVGTNGAVLFQSPSSTTNMTIPITLAEEGPITITFHTDGSGQYDGFQIATACVPFPSCSKPAALTATNATASSVDLGWTENGAATSWILEWDTLRNGWNNATSLVVSSNPYSLTGLQAESTYRFRVRGLCDDGDTADWCNNPLTFTTTQAAASIPYSYDFEDAAEWNMWGKNSNNNVHWQRGAAGSSTLTAGTAGAYVTGDDSTANFVNSINNVAMYRDIDFGTTQSSFIMEFDAQMGGNTTARYDGLMVFLVDPSAPVVASQAGITSPWGNVNDLYRVASIRRTNLSADDTWTHFDCSFDTVSGIKRVAFFWFNQATDFAGSMAMIDNLSIVEASCARPVGLTVDTITSNSAMLSWTGDATATYQISYRPYYGGTNTYVTVTGNSYLLTGLTSATDYAYWVRKICSATDTSLFSDGILFTTECDAIVALPWTEDFEGVTTSQTSSTGELPNCWVNMPEVNQSASNAPQVYWTTSTGYTHSGNYCLWMYYRSVLALPAIDHNLDSLQMTFWVRQTSTSYKLVVGVLDSMAISGFVPIDTISCSQTSTPEQFTVYFAGYQGSGRRIAFRNFYDDPSYSYDYSYNYIDDIVVDYAPSCYPVQNLTSTGNSASTVTVDWTDLVPATEWEVAVDTLANSTVVNAHPYTIQNLNGGQSYDIYVRTICGAGDSSTWVGPLTVVPGTWTMRPNHIDTISMCGGVIYDAGGLYGSYENSENSTLIVMPDAPGNAVHLQGTYSTESSYDKISIYDGIGTSGTCLLNQASGSGTINFTSTTTDGALTIVFSSDGSVNSYDGWAINVSCVSNTCPMVTNLHVLDSTITSSTATVDWTEAGTATQWEVAIVEGGNDVATGNSAITTSHPYAISGLDALTGYDVYVRPICSATDTGGWNVIHFGSGMCEDGTTIALGDDTNYASTSYAPATAFYNYSSSEVIILASELEGLQDGIGAFEFYSSNTTGSGSMHNTQIYMGNITDSTFVNGPISIDNSFTMVFDGDLAYTTGWNRFAFNQKFNWDGLSNVLVVIDRNEGSYSSSGSYRITNTNTSRSYYLYSDSYNPDPTDFASFTGTKSAANWVPNYHFFACPSSEHCNRPVIVNVTNDYANATITWTGNGNNYEVEVKPASQGAWSNNSIAVQGYTYTFTGLAPETQYQFRVRQDCDTLGYSDWAMGTFTTDSLPCLAPTNLVAAPAGTSAQLSWTPASNENEWMVKIWNTTMADSMTVAAPSTVITNLIAGNTYNVAVKALCGNGAVESNWSDVVTFTTVECQPVTGVQVTNVTNSSATISWTNNAQGATQWRVEYGEAGYASGEETVVTVSQNPYTINGLDANTNYEVNVTAICGDQWVSVPTSPVSFTTENVGIDAVDGINVTIYPNPAQGMTTISLTGVEGQVELSIVDMSGRRVMSESVECASADCVKTINVESLAQGAYFVRINGENVNMVKKLIVK